MDLPILNLPGTGQIVGYLFSLIGAVLCATAVRLYFKQRAFLRDAVSAQGIIVGLASTSSISATADDRTTAQSFSNPTVKFRAASGQEVTFESTLGRSSSPYRVGDTVRVRYRPDRLAEAEIDAFAENWFLTIAAAATGGVLLVVGLGSAIFSGS